MANTTNHHEAPTALALAMMAALQKQAAQDAAGAQEREYQAAVAAHAREHANWKDELHPAWVAECQRIEALRTRFAEVAATPKCITKDGKLAMNIKVSKQFVAETGITCAAELPQLPAEPAEPLPPVKPAADPKPAAKNPAPTASSKRAAPAASMTASTGPQRLETIIDLLTNPESTIDDTARADLEAELAKLSATAHQLYMRAKAGQDLLALPADQRERLVRAMLKRERRHENQVLAADEARKQGRIEQIVTLLQDPRTKAGTYQQLMDELEILAPELVQTYSRNMVEGVVVAVIGDRFPEKLPLFARAARIIVEGRHPGQRDREEAVIEVSVDNGKSMIRFDPRLTAAINIQKELAGLTTAQYQAVMQCLAKLPETARREDDEEIQREKQRATRAVLAQVERVNKKLASLIELHLRFRGPRGELRNLKTFIPAGKKVRVTQYEEDGVLVTDIGTARREDEPTHVLDALWGWGSELPATITLTGTATATGSICFFLAEIGTQAEIADPDGGEAKPRYFGKRGMQFDAHVRDNEVLEGLGAVYIPEPAPPEAVFRRDIVVGDASGIFTREMEVYDPLANLGQAVIEEPEAPYAALVREVVPGALDGNTAVTDNDPFAALTISEPPILGLVNGGKAKEAASAVAKKA